MGKYKFLNILTEEFFKQPNIQNLNNAEIGRMVNADLTTVRLYRQKFNLISPRQMCYKKSSVCRTHPLLSWQYGLIAGLLLGDGYMGRNKYGKYVYFGTGHGPAQKEYTYFLREMFSNVCSKGVRKVVTVQSNSTCYYFTTVGNHPDLIKIYSYFYDQTGRKRITQKWLNLLTPAGLVLWFYDDGHRTDGRKYYFLATHCFSLEEHKLLRRHLYKKFGIKTSIIKCRYYEKTYYQLYFAKSTIDVFEKHLTDYYLPTFKYKIHPSALPSSETEPGACWSKYPNNEDTVRTS